MSNEIKWVVTSARFWIPSKGGANRINWWVRCSEFEEGNSREVWPKDWESWGPSQGWGELQGKRASGRQASVWLMWRLRRLLDSRENAVCSGVGDESGLGVGLRE